jgi:hypothetical protein
MLTIKDALHHQKLFGWDGSKIAVGTLVPSHGKVKMCPSGRFPSHMEWWCPVGVSREEPFEIHKDN